MNSPMFRSAGGNPCAVLRAMLLASLSWSSAALTQEAATPEERAAKLVAAMTVEEKTGLLMNTSPAIPRLGIPDYQWWNEGLHGVAGDPDATNFPEPIGLAASFDTPLLNRIASTISIEASAISDDRLAAGRGLELGAGRTIWSPNINIFRDPRWGRGQETYGEDPFLTARMGVAYVTGIQGPDPDRPRNIATPKHFAVHSGPEPTRHEANVNVSLHDLRDTYLPAFRAAVVEGKAGSVMCAYNSINGQPACGNDFLLKTTLRGAWGFKGLVVSDCEAVSDIWQKHRYAKDAVAAAAVAVRAGTDNECTGDGFFDPKSFGRPQNYAAAVAGDQLSMAQLDQAAVRTLVARIRTGALDRRPAGGGTAGVVNAPTHRALALKAADEAMVLLKNDGLLPLGRKPLKIAVIGPMADARRALRGNYTSRDSSAFASVFDGIRRALPGSSVTLVAAGESMTDGNVVPSTALRSEDGTPGLTMRYYPAISAPGPAPKSIIEKVVRFSQAKFATVATRTEVVPTLNVEAFNSHLLPQGGKAVASGFLVPPVTGRYRLGLRGLATDLQFDGNAFVSVPLAAGIPTQPVLKTVELEAGKRYPITVTTLVPGIQFIELDWQRVSASPDQDVTAAARDADVVIAVVGIDSTLESEEGTQNFAGFKGGDRTSLDLPADQLRLLETAKATGKPLVVVNMSGSPINLEWPKVNANAVIQAWYPGEAGGTAVGRAIAGLTNPAGRLPVTFYRSVADLPPFENYEMTGRTYRYYEGKPVFPFGYGLSYTTFAYGPVSVKPRGASTSHGITVETELTNTGKLAGEEVAQLYLKFPDVPGAPRIALRGFTRVALAAGKTQTVRFDLSPRDMSVVSPDGKIGVVAGDYRLYVGGGLPATGVAGASAALVVRTPVELPN